MAITNGYSTLAQVKAGLGITDTFDDTLLEMAVESASRAIDQYCARNFYSTVATRVYTPRDSFVTDIDDLSALTSIKTSTAADGVFDTTWASTDYQLEPLNGVVDGLPTPAYSIRAVGDYTWPISGGEATVQVIGTFGFESVPIAITQATVIQASRVFKRLDSPLGIISGEYGSMRVGVRLDPDVAQLVDAYRKIRFA